MLAPSEDFGALLMPFVQLAVAVILFDGGLNLRLHELKTVGTGVRRLITIGPVLAFMLGSAAAHIIGGLSWPVALVFGAITIVTGSDRDHAVAAPRALCDQRTASILKWEGIVNDPVGALLAVVLFEYFTLTDGVIDARRARCGLLEAVVAAGLFGGLVGYVLGRAYPQGYFPEYLKGPTMLAAVLFVYAGANILHDEAGLVAATALGLVMGNMNLPSIEELRRFKEYITVILVSGLFIVLTADLDPGIVAQMDWRSWALLAAVIFVVRPLTVFGATLVPASTARSGSSSAGSRRAGLSPPPSPVRFPYGSRMRAMRMQRYCYRLVFALILHHRHAPRVLDRASRCRYLGIAAKKQNGVIIVGASPWTIDLAKNFIDLEILGAPRRFIVAPVTAGTPRRACRFISGKSSPHRPMKRSIVSSMGTYTPGRERQRRLQRARVYPFCERIRARRASFSCRCRLRSEHETKGLVPALRGQSAFSAGGPVRRNSAPLFSRLALPENAFYGNLYDRRTTGRSLIAAAICSRASIVKPNGALVIGPRWTLGSRLRGDTLINFVAAEETGLTVCTGIPFCAVDG